MDICDEHGIPEEFRYDNDKEEPIPGTKTQIIMSNLYIIVRSSDPYTQRQNKCEGQISNLRYRPKRRMIHTNTPDLLRYFCTVNESDIVSRMSRE